MQIMVETFILSITSFVGTNIDDIFINTSFFTEAKTKADNRNIVIGIYPGMGVLILLSVFGAFGLQFLPRRYIGYSGLVPIGLGIKEMIVAIKSKKPDEVEEKVCLTFGGIYHSPRIPYTKKVSVRSTGRTETF